MSRLTSVPDDADGRPGGLVLLDRTLSTIVVPDLHARMDFFLSVLGYEAEKERRAIELLDDGASPGCMPW